MDRDGVSIAFGLILDEITAVEDQLSAEGSTAFHEKRYSAADDLSAAGKKLVAFREKLEMLNAEWKSGIELAIRRRVKVEPGYSITHYSKAAKTTLRVTLKSGRVFQRPTAASTFADVIEEFGIEAVKRHSHSVSGVPLIDTKPHSRYGQERRGKYFIMTHSNTKAKKDMLERIAYELGKAISVTIV